MLLALSNEFYLIFAQKLLWSVFKVTSPNHQKSGLITNTALTLSLE